MAKPGLYANINAKRDRIRSTQITSTGTFGTNNLASGIMT